MRRRVTAFLATLGLAAGGVLAGCGIPDHTDVKIEGQGPVGGPGAETNTNPMPKERDDATSAAEFVKNFLEAAAGESGERLLKTYMAPSLRDSVSLKSGIAVVEVRNTEFAADNTVTLTVRHIGVLNANGELLPPSEPGTTTYPMKIDEIEGNDGFFVTKAPPVPLMSVDALSDFYTDRTVYFWNATRTALVPDLRWLSVEVPSSRAPTELLRMIESGPSPWLDGVASPLPDGSKLLANAPLDGDLLSMNWSPSAVDNNYQDYLAQQVAWTMSEYPRPSRLQLKINGQIRETYDVEPLRARLPYPVGADVHAYVVVDGRVRAVKSSSPSIVIPLAGAADQNVRWAAFGRRGEELFGAVVSGTTLRVGSAVGGPVTSLRPVAAIVPTSPPVWLPESRLALVTTERGLYTVGLDGEARRLTPREITGAITSVAAAPDGQRIALVADGNVYVVPVSVSQDGTLALASPRPLAAPLDKITAVGWSGETLLTVGGNGPNNRFAIVDVTIDGALRFERTLDARGPVSMIAAYPENSALQRSSMVMYEAENATWWPRETDPRLERSDVVDDPAGTPGPDAPLPTAPFFVY